MALGVGPARALDLTEIDRNVKDEPKYQAKPQYCLVVFGLEAKTRVWLVADGNALHMSNGNGEVQGAGSHVFLFHDWANASRVNIGDIFEVDGTKHTSFSVTRHSDCWTLQITIAGSGRPAQRIQMAGYDPIEAKRPRGDGFNPADKLRFADRPQDAPIVHFNGMRSLGITGPKPTLNRRGDTTLKLGFGTPGLGAGTFAAFQGCAVNGKELVADIEFPGKTSAETVKVRTSIGNHH
jgi:hypothetical protein